MSFSLDPGLVDLHKRGGGSVHPIEGGFDLYNMYGVSYVLVAVNGGFEVRSYERAEEPSRDYSGTDLLAVQRQLLMDVGANYRDHERQAGRTIPTVRLPGKQDQVKAGYRLVFEPTLGVRLARDDGSIVPIEYRGSLTGLLVRHSYVADLPLELIIESLIDPGGAPLFSEFLERDT